MTATTPDPSDTKETSASFYRFFTSSASALQQQIARLGDTSVVGGERADAIEHCLAGIARLSDEVKEAAAYLPGYDQRMYSEQIKALSTHLTTTRTSVAPKAKFSFKSSSGLRKQASVESDTVVRKQQSTTSNGTSSLPNTYASSSLADERAKRDHGNGGNAIAEGPWGHGEGAVDAPDATEGGNGERDTKQEKFQDLAWTLHPTPTTPGQPFSITRLKNAHIVLRPSTSSSTSTSSNTSTTATVSHLSHTLIDVFGSSSSQPQPHTYTSLTLTNIASSIIITGPIAGPIHLTNVTNCILLVSETRQFRMHHSKNVDVYLHVTSRPVIEDCDGIKFAPVPEAFLGEWRGKLDGDGKEGEGMWDRVQDFNWLRAEQSPHWSVMPEGKREGVDWKRLREDVGDADGVREMVEKLEVPRQKQ